MKKKIITLIIFAVLIILYWFGFRPEIVKQKCYNEARDFSQSVMQGESNMILNNHAIQKRADYTEIERRKYQECLGKNGYLK